MCVYVYIYTYIYVCVCVRVLQENHVFNGTCVYMCVFVCTPSLYSPYYTYPFINNNLSYNPFP